MDSELLLMIGLVGLINLIPLGLHILGTTFNQKILYLRWPSVVLLTGSWVYVRVSSALISQEQGYDDGSSEYARFCLYISIPVLLLQSLYFLYLSKKKK